MKSKDMLLIIDLQKNFINEYTKEVPPKIEKLFSKKLFEYVAFTKFINDTNSQFYKILNYEGCMTDEDREIVIDTKNYPIFDKRIYSATSIWAGIRELERVCKIRYKETDHFFECTIMASKYDVCYVEKELSNYILCYEVHFGDSHAMV